MALGALANRVAVQLFKRLPWLGDVWARRRAFVESTSVPWTPLRRPVRECTVALVTTAGVHLASDPPFDMQDPDGDPSLRVIPVEAPRNAVRITHKYYDHSAADPIGAHGHGLGASIDFRPAVANTTVVPERLRLWSYTSIELNTSTNVPEWNNQRVTIMGEDDAVMTENGFQFVRPRQTEFYLIK